MLCALRQRAHRLRRRHWQFTRITSHRVAAPLPPSAVSHPHPRVRSGLRPIESILLAFDGVDWRMFDWLTCASCRVNDDDDDDAQQPECRAPDVTKLKALRYLRRATDTARDWRLFCEAAANWLTTDEAGSRRLVGVSVDFSKGAWSRGRIWRRAHWCAGELTSRGAHFLNLKKVGPPKVWKEKRYRPQKNSETFPHSVDGFKQRQSHKLIQSALFCWEATTYAAALLWFPQQRRLLVENASH